MPKKPSITSRTRSLSQRKPAKKWVARPRQDWKIMWIRAVNGDEYISTALVMPDGILMYDPTMITYIQGNLVLSPYGVMTKEKAFFLQSSVILHLNEASPGMGELYVQSLETVGDYVEENFNALINNSLAIIKQVMRGKKIMEEERGPTKEELDAIELDSKMQKILGSPPGFEAEEAAKPRTRSQTIDDLVKLAEAQGKGKNKSG